MHRQPRVPVVAMDGTPLMPTIPAHARILLRAKVAKPQRNKLGIFYIRMLIPVGTATQPMALAIDPGARYDGVAVAAHRQVELTGELGGLGAGAGGDAVPLERRAEEPQRRGADAGAAAEPLEHVARDGHRAGRGHYPVGDADRRAGSHPGEPQRDPGGVGPPHGAHDGHEHRDGAADGVRRGLAAGGDDLVRAGRGAGVLKPGPRIREKRVDRETAGPSSG